MNLNRQRASLILFVAFIGLVSLSKENTDLVAKLLDSGWAETAYEDDEARIIKIRDQKGAPPDDDVDQKPETPDEKKILDDMEKNDAANNSNADPDEDNLN